jgi:hypothetical protein
MAKKTAARTRGRASKAKPRGTAKKPVRKSPRSARASRASTPATAADRLTAAEQSALFRAIEKTLAQHGVRGKLVSFQLAEGGAGGEVVAEARERGAAKSPCPPSQVRRMVCARDEFGVIVCGPRCVPLAI